MALAFNSSIDVSRWPICVEGLPYKTGPIHFQSHTKKRQKKYTFAFINEEFVHSCIILLHKNRKLKWRIIFVLINIKKAGRKLLYFLHLLITYVGLHASFNQKYWTFSLTHIILLIITLNTMDIPRWRCKTIFLHRE